MPTRANETLLVSKAQKITGQRQTWAVYRRRPNVSATVWDEEHRAQRYYSASYARQVAEELFGAINWRRDTGRGSANFYGKLA